MSSIDIPPVVEVGQPSPKEKPPAENALAQQLWSMRQELKKQEANTLKAKLAEDIDRDEAMGAARKFLVESSKHEYSRDFESQTEELQSLADLQAKLNLPLQALAEFLDDYVNLPNRRKKQLEQLLVQYPKLLERVARAWMDFPQPVLNSIQPKIIMDKVGEIYKEEQ